MRPPRLSRASSMVTFLLARPSSRAAIRPEAPAPDTGNQADHRVWAFLLRSRRHRELAQAFLFDRADLVAHDA
jgi:hypothetical protein